MEGVTLRRLDALQNNVRLENGQHVLGRGPLLQCVDQRVSRHHVSLGISDDGEIVLKSLHDNPSYFKLKNEPEFKPLKKGESVVLHIEDEFQLSPDSYCYKVERSSNSTEQHQESQTEETEGGNYAALTQNVSDDASDTHMVQREQVTSNSGERESEGVSDKDRIAESEANSNDRKLPDWMLASSPARTKHTVDVSDDDVPKAKRKNHGSLSSIEKEKDTEQEMKPTFRMACKYGSQCYRRNPVHREEFSHPGDSDWEDLQAAGEGVEHASADLPECPYGTACYRRNPQHRQDFKHTKPPTKPKRQREAKKKPNRKKSQDEDYESLGDDDYDYDDPFIDDTEEAEEDSEDETWEPNPKDNKPEPDPELLREDEWESKAEDEPEVLELLKEARDFLRNKKLQQH